MNQPSSIAQQPSTPFEIIVIGTSLGGLSALEVILEGLDSGFPTPIATVMHRSVDSGQALSSVLRRHSALRIREPQDKEEIRSGAVYIAPADYHLIVERGEFALSTEGPVSYARPSIDVLFASAADAYGEGVLGIILTGANHDGAHGVTRIKARGGYVLAQEPATAECAVMPRAAITTGCVDHVLPLTEIAPFLMEYCHPQE